jgi:transcriptional regulator with XRE-family HTH domain
MREKIKIIMQKRGISARDLSEKTGIRYQTITNYLNLNRNIKYSYFETIVFLLGLELTEREN